MCNCENETEEDDLRFHIINQMHEATGVSRSFLICLYHDIDIHELSKICVNLQCTSKATISKRYHTALNTQ